MEFNQPHTPLWVKAVIILAMLPVLAFPWLIGGETADTEVRVLLWLYPAYVLVTGLCAWICYRQRPELTWILIVLLLLTNAGMIWLRLHNTI